MKIHLDKNSSANITFNNSARVSISGDQGYLVKWFLDDNFYGEMYLNAGQWGAYSLEIGNWKLEFHKENNIINYDLNLNNKKVLFIYTFNSIKGKLPNIQSMIDYIEELKNTYNFIPYVYFKGSEKYNIPFETLKLNHFIDFDLIIEKHG